MPPESAAQDIPVQSPRLAYDQSRLEAACLGVLGKVFGDYALDAVVLGDADPLLRWEIMRDGRLLFGDPMRFLEYRAFAYKDFIDSADLRRVEAALFRKRMDWIREQLHAAA